MKHDTPSYDELQQDHARHWKSVGAVRDQRYQAVKQALHLPWRCPTCACLNDRGGVCGKCRAARIVEIE